MKHSKVLMLVASCLALWLQPVPVHAASPATASATITGRIQNSESGRYLENARVAVTGTNIVTFTDEFGSYRLTGLPAGPLVLEIKYTGLETRKEAVATVAGGSIVHDVDMSRTSGDGTVKLAEYVVSGSRETEGEALATNEQRYAPNIKNVVATDIFGDVQEANVGEFIKFLPGVSVNYGDAEAQSVSLRGFSPHLSGLTVDGALVSNANFGGATRAPMFDQTTISNIARVEISKVPTPSTPADSLGGSINMVTKSAFERTRAELRYRFYLTGNSHRLTVKDPYTFDEEQYMILPSFDFDYTLPITKNLGIVVTGMTSNFYNEQHLHQSPWLGASNGTNASPANPIRTGDVVIDAPRFTWRRAIGVSADWRVTPNSVLSVDLSHNGARAQTANVSRSTLTGSSPTPTVSVANGGVALSFGPDFTIGSTGRGDVNLAGNSINRFGHTNAAKIRYRFDNGDWRVNAVLSRSASQSKVRGGGDGWIFTNLSASTRDPVRVSLTNVGPVGDGDSPTIARAFLNNNTELDLNDLSIYDITGATSNTRDITDDVVYAEASVRRRLGFVSFPAAVQVGALERIRKRDVRRANRSFTYNGINGSRSAAPYGYDVYVNQDSGFGARDISFVHVGATSDAFRANPALFSQTLAQQVAEAVSRITTSEYIREENQAFYAQAEAQFFRNRLRVLTGVRYEETRSDGQGPVYDPGAVFQRNPDGTFIRNAQGQRIRRPEAGAAGSLQEVALTREDRGNLAKGGYDGYYPSAHFTFLITQNFLLRVAYAKTYGRPDFDEVIPNVVINQADLTEEQLEDPEVIPGTLTLRNSALRPWTADNYDVSLEYYTDAGGVLTAGAFAKDIEDFFASDVRLATPQDLEQFGLDPQYEGYRMTTTRNAGDAKISGFEFSLRQTLAPFGEWGRAFRVFANATKLNLEGDRDADFGGFIEESASWGVTYSRKPFTVMAKWNWRGEQKGGALAASYGTDAYSYTAPRTHLDVNLDWQFRKNLSLFFIARNVFDERNVIERRGSLTADYAKVYQSAEYGAQLSLGVKGRF